jgi:hypothetical protein
MEGEGSSGPQIPGCGGLPQQVQSFSAAAVAVQPASMVQLRRNTAGRIVADILAERGHLRAPSLRGAREASIGGRR